MFEIRFGLHIDRSLLPAFLRSENYANNSLFYKHGVVSKNKSWEIQVARWTPDTLFEFVLDLRMRGRDHAGPNLRLEIFGFMFDAQIHDNRHWNHDANRWYLPGEEAAEWDGDEDYKDEVAPPEED